MELLVTTGAIRHAKLQSNRHHQQTNSQFCTAECPSNSVKALKGNLCVCMYVCISVYVYLCVCSCVYRLSSWSVAGGACNQRGSAGSQTDWHWPNGSHVTGQHWRSGDIHTYCWGPVESTCPIWHWYCLAQQTTHLVPHTPQPPSTLPIALVLHVNVCIMLGCHFVCAGEGALSIPARSVFLSCCFSIILQSSSSDLTRHAQAPPDRQAALWIHVLFVRQSPVHTHTHTHIYI